MRRRQSVNMLKFLLSLSDALDLASSLLTQHQLRTAFIAWRLCEELRFPRTDVETVVAAALIHDIGALAPEDKIDLHEETWDGDVQQHCIVGEQVLRRSPLLEPAAAIVRWHHTPWSELKESAPTCPAVRSQVVFLADKVERAIDREEYILHQDDAIRARVRELRQSDLHPELADAFRALATREDFWLDLVSPRLQDLMSEAPLSNFFVPQTDLLDASRIIRDVIDFRCHFTATHSAGVSCAATVLARLTSHSEDQIELMELAGNLHDIGKMAVPNSILAKPGTLTDEEFAIVRQHPYHTHNTLLRCGFSRTIAEWAGFHHEKLDGSGYPFHVDARSTDVGARILQIADNLIALAENRPYRAAFEKKNMLKWFSRQCTTGRLDPNLVDLLATHYEEVIEPTLEEQRLAETRFADLMALAEGADSAERP